MVVLFLLTQDMKFNSHRFYYLKKLIYKPSHLNKPNIQYTFIKKTTNTLSLAKKF